MVDKVLISNRSALLNKYGTAGFALINAAIMSLINADKARNLVTKCVWVDDPSQMAQIGGTPPTNAKDQKGNKAAVDAIDAKLSPDYIVLLDGPDVIPHISLKNPLSPDDRDQTIDSDLPYASPASFSGQVAPYLSVGISRVVGRIPSTPNATDPESIIKFINTAAQFTSRPPSDYLNYFGLTAESFQNSTLVSLHNIFGNNTYIVNSPPHGPSDANRQPLANLSHFINCHGTPNSSIFFGGDGNPGAPAMTTAEVLTNARPGTVVAAEVCYGAQLYDPGTDPAPICVSYLTCGAVGFFGSTNTCYSAPNNVTVQLYADLITQYFFQSVLRGTSLGRALLEARLKFLQSSNVSMKDPHNLKTLAQFLLLGDPSVQPCMASSPREDAATDLDQELDATAQRKARRVALSSTGTAIAHGIAVPGRRGKVSDRTANKIRAIAKDRGYSNPKMAVFYVQAASHYRAAMNKRKVRERVVVVSHRAKASRRSEPPSPIVPVRHLVIQVVNDRIASIRESISH
jgi:hypothetical protein